MKPANKQYSNLPNDYEMTLGNDSVIQECVDSSSDIPAVKYDFVPISRIAEMETNTVVGKSHIKYIIQLAVFKNSILSFEQMLLVSVVMLVI